MANCEETPCINVQSAICLHCSRRLCAPHIIAHGTALLKEGDELCEQINQLTEHLSFSLQKIDRACEEATHKLGVWRQDQIDKIEYKYAEKLQVIETRKDHLTDLENELTKRLNTEAKQPLDRMQTQQNASSQALQKIRQNIAIIIRDSAQLDLSLKPSSSSIQNIAATNRSPLPQFRSYQQEYDNNATQYYFNPDTAFISNEDQRTSNQYYSTAMNTLQPSSNSHLCF
jgi:chromosome segregation ATPase